MHMFSKILTTAAAGGLALAAGTALQSQSADGVPEARAGAQEIVSGLSFPPLAGTKCWELNPAFGKSTFLQLRFLPIGDKQSLLSGNAFRNDGSKPDRVLQLSGSASKNRFVGDDGYIKRYLMNLTYSFNKTNTDPVGQFDETGAVLRGQYTVRLDPSTLNGRFDGNDIVMDWTPPLSGPSNTFAASGPNEIFGSIQCDGTFPGLDNCGTIIPLNNTGTMTLVGEGTQVCNAANPRPRL